MGESFGAWRMGSDAEVMPLISSTNIACGFHAGDPATMRRTIELALEHGVAIGAHPGYPDLQGFGRRNIAMSPAEAADIVLYQVSALNGMCEALGGRLRHVKPHGALYNRAARDRPLAAAIAAAVRSIDPGLLLYGLSGSFSVEEAEAAGLRSVSEVFADRSYEADGSLTPRSEPDAVLADPAQAARRAVRMAAEGTVTARDGSKVGLRSETICIHGDGPLAIEFASAIRDGLTTAGIRISPP
jgi:5-oxoprolinase (ATP-hydrolysing) subunit A